MKFGGTSVANKEAIQRAISIVRGRLDQRPVVVVSAMSKVTDSLYRIAGEAAAQHEAEIASLLDQLRNRHIDTASELLADSGHFLNEAISDINTICDYLEKVALSVCALGELSARSKAIIISQGEILSSTIIAHAMNAYGIDTEWLDARKMIISSGNPLNSDPIFSEINARVPGIIEKGLKHAQAVITQGFISSAIDGEPTVLGRGGSDYSASLIGMAINALLADDEKVVIQPPVYHPFRLVPQGNKRQLVYNPLICNADGSYTMDFDNLAEVCDPKCKMLILSNPHNPAGIVWDRETLQKLASFCHERGVIVISDEIHCDMALFGNKHIPFASVSEEAASCSITFGSPSKMQLSRTRHSEISSSAI